MYIGALVAKQLRWGADYQIIGIVVHKSKTLKNGWTVLWSLANNRYKLQDHISFALIDLSKITTQSVKIHGQIILQNI